VLPEYTCPKEYLAFNPKAPGDIAATDGYVTSRVNGSRCCSPALERILNSIGCDYAGRTALRRIPPLAQNVRKLAKLSCGSSADRRDLRRRGAHRRGRDRRSAPTITFASTSSTNRAKKETFCRRRYISSAIGTNMSQNTLIHGLVRPAVRVVAARTSLTPNHVTTFRLATGLGAAVTFAQGTYGWLAIGGSIFLLSILLDRADGELARQTNQISLAGHRYDLVSDCIVGISAFLGIAIGAVHIAGLNALWLGALAGVGIGVLFLELNVLKLAGARGYDLFGGRVRVDPDDAMIVVPVFVWCDLATPLLIGAAVVTPLTALGLGAIGLFRRPVRRSR
jgi:archaetidylinositol phosphate synthase